MFLSRSCFRTLNLSFAVSNLTAQRHLSQAIKIAVIGSGPAGFYTTQALLKNPDVHVDIYEKAPVPFGLIRFGVAPDHPEVKNVISTFNKIAENERVTFNGNVAIGNLIGLKHLRDAYDIVVLAYGSTEDRTLNIEGENLPCVIPAKRFVGWYNGVAEDKDLPFDLDQETVVIIGQGNVALDCARILLTSVETHLKNTDITDYALEKLEKSRVKRVHLIGRRGPLQVAFKTKELREMTKMSEFCIHIDPDVMRLASPENLDILDRPRKRLVQLMQQIARESEHSHGDKQCHLEFLQSPLKVTQTASGPSLELCMNRLVGDIYAANAGVQMTDERKTLPFGLLLRSIGYKCVSIDSSIPMDEKSGIIRNENGKISELGDGLYCSGWAATGANGVIVGTMNAAHEIGENILNEIANKKIPRNEPKAGRDAIMNHLSQHNVRVVSFADWKKIDQLEQERGKKTGKSREKFVNTKDILDAL